MNVLKNIAPMALFVLIAFASMNAVQGTEHHIFKFKRPPSANIFAAIASGSTRHQRFCDPMLILASHLNSGARRLGATAIASADASASGGGSSTSVASATAVGNAIAQVCKPPWSTTSV